LAKRATGKWRVVLARKEIKDVKDSNGCKAASVVLDRSAVEDHFNGHGDMDDAIKDNRKKSFKTFLSEFDIDDDKENNDPESGDEWDAGVEASMKHKKPKISKAGNLVLGKKNKVERRATLASTFARPEPPKRELTEYEEIQQKNIADRKAIFEDLWKAKKEAEMPKIQPVARKFGVARRRTAPGVALFCTRTEPINLRSRNVTGSSDKDSDSGISSGYSTPRWREGEECLSDGEEELPKRRRISHPKRWVKDPNVDVPTPEDVTDEQLENVAEYVSEKVYDRENGTTCHQCRQKTLDSKTFCRSGNCHGVRGYFCGVCLKNRYGQDVRVALKDPNWSCPPCQGKCNCSICRTRQNKCPTGILTGLAHQKGHASVAHYLEALKTKKGNDEYDEDDEE